MKKNIQHVILTAQVMLFAACGNAQSVTGSGHVITETRPVASFHQLQTDGVFNITIKQGDKEEVLIEADDNIVPLIIVENSNGTLKLSTKKHSTIKKSNKVHITVTAKTLDKLECDGVGNVSTDGLFKTDKLAVTNSSVGNLSLQVVCTKLNVKATGVGNVTLKGTAMDADIKNDGVGNLNAETLAVEILRVNNSGVGNTNATASKEAYLEDSGVGNIKFKGEAAIKHLDKSGVGKISVN